MGPTVLIVDDHSDFRAAARALLESEGLHVVGDAPDGEQGIAEALRLQPQVVLLDIQLPGIDGFEVARRLTQLIDPPLVVLVSSREATSYGHQLTEVGACGFLTKRDLSGAALLRLVS